VADPVYSGYVESVGEFGEEFDAECGEVEG